MLRYAEAVTIADEQRRYWRARDVSPTEAYFALTGRLVKRMAWTPVVNWMVRWLLAHEWDVEERIAA
jgi:hypothetical protein